MKIEYRNMSYHKHFEDYEERIVPKVNGEGTRIELHYIGDYYQQAGTTGQLVVRRILYIALFLAVVFFFVYSAVKTPMSSTTWYLILAEAATLLGLDWLMYALICYAAAKRKMTIGDYKSGSRSVIAASKVCTVCFIVMLAAQIFIYLGRREQLLEYEIKNIIGYFLAGLLVAIIGYAEVKVNYIRIPGEKKEC